MRETRAVTELTEWDGSDGWDERTTELLRDAYLAGGAGPRGSGAGDGSEGVLRAKRQHLAVPMDVNGSWLDIGCANGHLLATLPIWTRERGVVVEAHGLELIPDLADLARSLHPELADRIWTGSVVTWVPPRRFRYVTALDDAVPPHRLGVLVERLLAEFVEPGGRVIVSSYTNRGVAPRPLFSALTDCGFPPSGTIHIDRPNREPLLTAWIDVP